MFRLFFIVVSVLLMFGGVCAADLSMNVAVDRSVIYQGERLAYQIALIDSDPIDNSITPDLSAYNDFEIKTLPKQAANNSGSSIHIVINGKTVRQESSKQSRAIFTYELTPKRSGELVIPPPNILANGRKITPTSVTVADRSGIANTDGSIPITVKAPDNQDVVSIHIESDRERLYPFQTFTVTLVVQVKALPTEIMSADRSPISILREPPNITVPWANDDNLPKGLQPTKPMNDWLASIRTTRQQRGFSINEYAARGIGFGDDFFNSGMPGGMNNMMNDMMRGRLLHFAPTPKQIVRKDANGKNAVYWEYRFAREFLSSEIADYKFGAAIIKGNFAIEDKTNEEGARAKLIYALAPAININIIDVPTTNRPDSYIGAFGRFDLNVDIQPRKAKRGEPMTLTIKLQGKGSTGNIKPPDLTTIPEITTNFKTHSPTEEGNNTSCTFTYPIRATKSGQLTFPSIPLTYFDVEKEEFVTLSSGVIPLDIAEVDVVEGAGVNFSNALSGNGDFVRSDKGLFANMSGRSDVVDRSVDYVGWLVSLVSLGVIYAVFLMGHLIWQNKDNNPKKRRRLNAHTRAKQRLTQLTQQNNNSQEEIIKHGNELQMIIFGFVADLIGVSEQGMTTKEACEKFAFFCNDVELSAELHKVLEMLDGTKYGGLDLRSLDEQIAAINHILANSNNRQAN
ncbi:MAG: BatD family protein [Planctomycetaceae bacterium]|jgi:hypothetical protein|nr:BatD family protein [Planctomycetaceae bacterium]